MSVLSPVARLHWSASRISVEEELSARGSGGLVPAWCNRGGALGVRKESSGLFPAP